VENEAVEQVAFAEKILLNKIDLSNETDLAKIEQELKKINPTAPIRRTEHSQVPPAELLNIGAFELKRVLDFDPEFLDENQEHEHDATVSSAGVKVEGEVNLSMLECWIERLITEDGANLYRYKGIIAVKGKEEKFVFQGVGMLFSGGFENIKWKPDEKRESRFVFIGKNLDHVFYRSAFLACKVDYSLRFAVGEEVEANVGSFKRAKVIKHWDDGNAYRLEIQDGSKTNVWAPVDVNAYIRAPARRTSKRLAV
jgi:G3E family GTPase